MTTSSLKIVLACAVGLLACMTGFAQSKPKIAVVTHGQASDPFWLIVRNGVEAAAAETGCEVDYRAPGTFDLGAMARLIDAAVAAKPDGMVVSIPDSAPLSASIRAAVAARIPVVCINSGRDAYRKLGCLMFIGQEEELAGRKAGERMKASGVKDAIILNQEAGNAALEERIKGFRNGFEGPFHHVQVIPVTMDYMRCQAAVAARLEQDPALDGIVALGPVAAEPALQALDEFRRLGKVQLCTFDTSPAILQALIKKQMAFAIDQQEWLQGYLSVLFLANHAKYGLLVQNESIQTGPSFVTPENAARVVDLLSMGFR